MTGPGAVARIVRAVLVALAVLPPLAGCSRAPATFRGMKVGMPVSEFRAAFPGAEEKERGFVEGVHMVRYHVRSGNGVNVAEFYFKSDRLAGAILFFDATVRIEALVWEVSAANGKPDLDHGSDNARVVKWGESLTLFRFAEPTVMELPSGEKRRLNGIVMFLGN